MRTRCLPRDAVTCDEGSADDGEDRTMPKARIGVIGGSGLYEMDGLTDREEINVSTPFGDPSDVFILGTLEGRQVCFLSRHGRGHRYSPSEVALPHSLVKVLLRTWHLPSRCAPTCVQSLLPPLNQLAVPITMGAHMCV